MLSQIDVLLVQQHSRVPTIKSFTPDGSKHGEPLFPPTLLGPKILKRHTYTSTRSMPAD